MDKKLNFINFYTFVPINKFAKKHSIRNSLDLEKQFCQLVAGGIRRSYIAHYV
jgi:hypothetical protein